VTGCCCDCAGVKSIGGGVKDEPEAEFEPEAEDIVELEITEADNDPLPLPGTIPGGGEGIAMSTDTRITCGPFSSVMPMSGLPESARLAFDPEVSGAGSGDVGFGVGLNTFKARERRARCRGVRVEVGGTGGVAASMSICGPVPADSEAGGRTVALRKLPTDGMVANPCTAGIPGVDVGSAVSLVDAFSSGDK